MVKRVKRRAKNRAKTATKEAVSAKKRISEKIFFLAALLFMMFSIIILFNPNLTTFVVSDTTLSKANYALNESLTGQISLGFQPQDIIPADTRINIDIISSHETPTCNNNVCPTVYLCPDGQMIQWMFCNTTATPNKCQNITYVSGFTGQPDKECCYINQANCFGVEELLSNSGFELPLPGNWFATDDGGGVADKYPNIAHSGSASGRTDTTYFTTSATSNFAKLTQGFSAVPVSYFGTYTGVPETSKTYPVDITTRAISGFDFQDSLTFWIRYDVPSSTSTILKSGYYFEVIVRNQGDTRRLHYYFNINQLPPVETYRDKYIVLPNPPIRTWRSYTRNVYSDWRSKGLPSTDSISAIELYSAGKKVASQVKPYTAVMYGQQVLWDDVVLKYDTSTGSTCIGKGKKCCVEGTGIGNYYGMQLVCEAGECWDDCTESYRLSLEDFIKKSTSPEKGNKTSGAFKSGTTLLGGTGDGYAYCYETDDPNNGGCYEWNNEYILGLGEASAFNIKVPPYPGGYTFFLNITYTNFLGMTWGLDSVMRSFAVGGTSGPSCPDSDYNFTAGNWSDWGDCMGSIEERTRILYGEYQGIENCPETRNITDTQTQSCTSCYTDWVCEWQPCVPGEIQENYCVDLNYCEPNYASETRTCCIEDWQCGSWGSCEYGEQTRSCFDSAMCGTEFNKPNETRTCEKPLFISLWWLWVLIAFAIVATILIVKWKSIFRPRRRARKFAAAGNEYSELTNYIEQAFSYGATKEEIRRKLVDAGWPQEAIERAFRAAGR